MYKSRPKFDEGKWTTDGGFPYEVFSQDYDFPYSSWQDALQKKGLDYSKSVSFYGEPLDQYGEMTPTSMKRAYDLHGDTNPNLYNPYLNPKYYETYGDDYVPETLPQQTEQEQPAVSPQQVRANTRQATRPVRKPTTAVQDRKAAEKTYNAAVKAADKKAKAEVAQATKDIKKANSTLKRNGSPTYSLGNITSKSHQLPEMVITGNARKKNTSTSNTRIGGYAGMGGSMFRPGQSQQKSNRGANLINAIKGVRNAIGVASSKHKSNTKKRTTKNRGWNAWSLG